MKEYLFTCSPDKVFITINASDWSILILTVVTRFQCGCRFRLCHDLLPWDRLTCNKHFRRANKEQRVYDRTLFCLSTIEAQDFSREGCCVVNWYITMAKLCQGKSGIKLPHLDISSTRMGASALQP